MDTQQKIIQINIPVSVEHFFSFVSGVVLAEGKVIFLKGSHLEIQSIN